MSEPRAVCASCGAEQPYGRIVCKECGQPLVFPVDDPYRDERFAERQCDYCGKPYRGPAVYCSLECAVDDL
jgi:RNase P subunit RPR2